MLLTGRGYISFTLHMIQWLEPGLVCGNPKYTKEKMMNKNTIYESRLEVVLCE